MDYEIYRIAFDELPETLSRWFFLAQARECRGQEQIPVTEPVWLDQKKLLNGLLPKTLLEG